MSFNALRNTRNDVKIKGLTTLRIEGRGTDGSTTILDSSRYSRNSPVLGANTQLVTSQAFPGDTSSIGFDGNLTYMQYTPIVEETAINNFFFRCKIRPETFAAKSGANRAIIVTANSGSTATPAVLVGTAGPLRLFTGGFSIVSSPLILNVWNDFLWYRIGGVHRFQVNGIDTGSVFNNNTPLNPTLFRIGASVINETTGNFLGQLSRIEFGIIS